MYVSRVHFAHRGRKGFHKMAHVILTTGASRIEVDTDAEDCATLDSLIALYRDSANISSDATVAVNGDTDVAGDYEFEDDDVVSATKTSGSKG